VPLVADADDEAEIHRRRRSLLRAGHRGGDADGVEPVDGAPERLGEQAPGHRRAKAFRGVGLQLPAALTRLDEGVEREHLLPPSSGLSTTLPVL
jgi:hypothetical protein